MFNKIKQTLHFPQYLSYVFTGVPLVEYTSLGCHTILWDIHKKDYHQWVYNENLVQLFPKQVSSGDFTEVNLHGNKVMIGPGIHDSSASLLPYYLGFKKDFMLLSTGTWSILLNPYYKKGLAAEIGDNALHYLTIEGNPVLATRFFMGSEYKKQVTVLNEYYQKSEGYHKTVRFQKDLLPELTDEERYFKFEDIVLKRKTIEETRLDSFENFEHAYHQLIFELVQLQVRTIRMADPNNQIKRLFIDGGFSNNEIFVQLLLLALPKNSIRVTHNPYGAALGACIVGHTDLVGEKFLKTHYKPAKPKPVQI